MATGEFRGDDELTGVIGAFEGDFLGINGEFQNFGRLGQDQRFELGRLLVGVDVAGTQQAACHGESR